MRVTVILSIAVLCLSGGCATLMRGDTQKMKFETDPPHATVNVDGKDYAAPVTVPLKRKEPHSILVSAPGYQTIAFQLKSEWDGASLGNAVMPGGSAGFGMDTVNGADRSFKRLARIKLNAAVAGTTQPMTMYEYRGKVLTKEQYDKALQDEREYRSRSSFGD